MIYVNMKISLLEKKAKQFCLKNNLQLTNPRKLVLNIIVNSKKPIKAYDILEKLSKSLNKPNPPTVYRAIDFWHKNNFIHRIESLNSYSACSSGNLHAGSQFLICDNCGKVMESDIIKFQEIIKNKFKNKTFKPSKWNLEITGSCNECV